MNKTITVNGASAYHSYPDDGGKHPAIIIIEEIWGLNDQIKGVADRFAQAGFSALAPEILPRELLQQLTPQLKVDLWDPVKRNEAQPKMRAAMAPIMQPEYAGQAIATLKACVDYLLADEQVDGSVAVLGFCFGGSYSFHLAAQSSRIKAAVPFYGQAPSEDEVQKIQCPILAFYGDQDANLMQTLPELKETMQKYNKNFEAVVYPGAGHAFFNETNERMYRPDNAQDAWEKTIQFLKSI